MTMSWAEALVAIVAIVCATFLLRRAFGRAGSTPEAAELDDATQRALSLAISKAIASELGRVRVSSVPPSAPRSSLRVAAAGTGKAGKVITMIVGALAVAGQLIVWVGSPEHAGPIAQALKLIAQVIAAAAGGAPIDDAMP